MFRFRAFRPGRLARFAGPVATVLLVALAMVALGLAPARAYPLRAPQVPFEYSPLQAFLDTAYPGSMNVAIDQLDAQTISLAPVPNQVLVVLKLGTGSEVGIYGTDQATPTLVPLFAAGSAAGAYAWLSFQIGKLDVAQFDAQSNFLGQVSYTGLSADHVGFYVQGPCGTWFSEDARNTPPGPQVLAFLDQVYSLTPVLCFEPCAYTPASTFNGAVLDMAFPGDYFPDPARRPSWGRVKALYR